MVADERADNDEAKLRGRLLGVRIPEIELQAGPGVWVSLQKLASRRLVLFFYPGREAEVAGGRFEVLAHDRDRALAWSLHHHVLEGLNYQLVGVSSQTPVEQGRFERLEMLAYELLSDPDFDLAEGLGLPTTGPEWSRAYEPLTLIVRHERIAEVIYPVDPATEMQAVLAWIERNP